MRKHARTAQTFTMRIAAAALAATFLTVSACAVGPDYVPPPTSPPERFTQMQAATHSADQVSANFWLEFRDPMLAELIDSAVLANHDLRIALLRLAETRALRRETSFDLAPTITAAAAYGEQRSSIAQTGALLPREQNLYEAGFDAFWELDFFGRVRRGVEASRAETQGAAAGLHDVRVTVVAEVSRTYFELRGQQQQLEVARRNVDNQRMTLELTAVRLEAGRGTALDTSRAEAQLEGTLTTIGPLEAAIARSIHRLGVLTGRAPAAWQARLAEPQDLPVLPVITAIGDPATLMRTRPDIRVAERALAADTARIGIAVADLFPRVSFVGSVGLASAEASELGDAGTGTRFIGPALSWAALDLGRVRARIAQAQARAGASLAAYEQSVLRALEEVESSLATHTGTRDRLAHASRAARASTTAADLAKFRFENGAIDFLEVLEAERSRLEAEDRLARTRADAATSLVALYKALGGGGSFDGQPPG